MRNKRKLTAATPQTIRWSSSRLVIMSNPSTLLRTGSVERSLISNVQRFFDYAEFILSERCESSRTGYAGNDNGKGQCSPCFTRARELRASGRHHRWRFLVARPRGDKSQERRRSGPEIQQWQSPPVPRRDDSVRTSNRFHLRREDPTPAA